MRFTNIQIPADTPISTMHTKNPHAYKFPKCSRHQKNLYRTILHLDMSLADDIADSLNEAFSEQGFGCVCALVWITLCVSFLCSFLDPLFWTCIRFLLMYAVESLHWFLFSYFFSHAVHPRMQGFGASTSSSWFVFQAQLLGLIVCI